MKKLIALLLTISMLFSVMATAAGCKKSTTLGDGDDVVIQFQLDDLGYGTQWLQESCERFMEQQKDVQYPGGKTGVYCQIVRSRAPTFNNINQTAVHVAFGGGSGDAAAGTGNVWNLNEVVTEMKIPGENKTIEDKMYPETRTLYRALDTYGENGEVVKQGNYYVIPTHEIYAGLTYDKTVFDNHGFYFARDKEVDYTSFDNFDVYAYEDAFGTELHMSDLTGRNYYFVTPKPVDDVEGWAQGKSCGPNGIYGDNDDGLPSSMYELIALWEYVKKNGIDPMLVSGSQRSLSNAFLDSLPSSLMGYDKARGQLDLNGSVDAVVGFSTTAMEQGMNYFEAPILQKIDGITEETGYYTTWAAEGFLDSTSYPNKSDSLDHLGAQKKFIDSGHSIYGGQQEEIAMFMEYSYWWNESTIRGNVNAFQEMNEGVTDREVRWMPLPVNIRTSVTGEDEEVSYRFAGIEEGTLTGTYKRCDSTPYTENKKGEKNILAQTSNNTLFVNKKAMEASEAEKQAVIDWLLFFHTDKELSAVTASAGFRKALDYKMQGEDISKWPSFYKDLYELSEKSDIIRASSNNETFTKSPSIFGRGEGTMAWQCKHSHFFDCYRVAPNKDEARSSRRCFIYIMIDKEEWKTYYKGGNHKLEVMPHINFPGTTEEIYFMPDDGLGTD